MAIALAERNQHEKAASLSKLIFAVESGKSEDKVLQSKIILDALPEYFLGDALLDKEKYAQAAWHFRKAADKLEEFLCGKQENNRSKRNEYDTDNSLFEERHGHGNEEGSIDDDNADSKEIYAYIAKSYCKLGTSLLNLKDFDNAIICLEYSAVIFRNCETNDFTKKRLRLINHLGECLYQQEKYSEALQRFEEAICMDNNAKMNILGDYEEYFFNVKKCVVRIKIKSEPDASSTCQLGVSARNVGDYLFEKGDYAEALEFYTINTNTGKPIHETIKNLQVLAKYYKTVGICFFNTNNFSEAWTYFLFFQFENLRNNLGSFTSDEEAADHFHLIARCLVAQGMHQEAFKHYEEAIAWQSKVTQEAKADQTMANLFKDLGSCCFQ